MEKRNRLIVLIDLSQFSRNLIDFSLRFSETIDARLLFVHLIPVQPPFFTDPETRESMIEDQKGEVMKEVERLSDKRVYGKNLVHVSDKDLLTTLEDVKSNDHFDWVLTGQKESNTFKRLFIGSTPLTIIDHSDLLSLTVPVSETIQTPKELLIGVHPRYSVNKEQLNVVLSSLKKQLRGVDFFTVLKDDEDEKDARELLSSMEKDYSEFAPTTNIFHGDTLTELKSYTGSKEDAFLVLQEGSHSLLDAFLRKFMINELVYEGTTPLIVLAK